MNNTDINIKVNDKIHGFCVKYIRNIDEIGAVLYEMEYEKNDAELIWLSRPDSNKTFSVTFKTIPEDDTGVFHILEHSVLGGSEKYPVKEPFVELLKGSMQTFLNAFTFPDKTMYPVCSRNDKDFLNLIDVYMDAVLHPTIYTKPETFWQEGWHYELASAEDELARNGVVYNEMQGAFSSVETIIVSELNRLLFPDNCYKYESGGAPASIPNLTYEQFTEAHRKFYHPSNSKFFLDGDINIDAVLSLLNSFIFPYEFSKVDAEIPIQSAVSSEDCTFEYEVSDDDDISNKVQYAEGFVFASFDDQEKSIAMDILTDVLCGSNEAPLKKAILDQNLAEDVYFSTSGMQQITATLVVRNTSQDKICKIKSVIRQVLLDLSDNGIDRELLTASFNNLEFVVKERDYGSMPQGLGFALSVLDSWLYGGDPAQNLSYNQSFAKLRGGIETGYFEELIRSSLLENNHRASVLLLPSVSYGEKCREDDASKLKAIKKKMTAAEVSEIILMNERLKKVQEAPDLAENLAKLPMLALSDISQEPETLPLRESRYGENTVLFHELETGGIVYADIFFSIADLSPEELSTVSLMCEVLTQTATESYSGLALLNKIKSNLGFLGVSPAVYSVPGQTKECNPYVVVGCGMLDSKKEDALVLIKEVLLKSVFDNKALVKNIISQRKLSIERGFTSGGSSYAARRVAAASSAHGVASGAFSGLEFYRYLRKAECDTDGLLGVFTELCKRIFVRERALISVTGMANETFAQNLLTLLPKQDLCDVPRAASYVPLEPRQEGIAIPAAVSFAAKGGNLYNIGADYSGAIRVATSLLSLGYLWNTIRVQGGAYGTGVSANINGAVCFTSYRDPDAARSLDCYDNAGNALREFCESGEALDKYIIGTVAETEPVLSNKQRGRSAAALYLSGISHESRRKTRKEILNTNCDDLRRISEILDEICAVNNVCVVGERKKLEACSSRITSITTMK